MTNLKFSYIGLGSNLGNKLQNIHLAYDQIQMKIGNIIRKSHVYQTPPWGFNSKDDFYNTVILVKTKLSAPELLEQLKLIEQLIGRKSAYKIGYSSRLIDLDILDFNNQVFSSSNLTVPHPHIEKRNFVLYPLFEINKDWVHPITGETIKSLMEIIDKSQKITRVNV